MARTHFTMLFVVEAEHFSGEKLEKREGVTIVTLTSFEGFAAEKGQLIAERAW